MDAQAILRCVGSGTGTSNTTKSLEAYDLGGVDCPLCGNTGQRIVKGEGLLDVRVFECECMNVRRSLRTIRNSGMSDMLERYTLDNYLTPDAERRAIKQSAEEFIKAPEGWYYIAGRSGSGKTHICTAICGELIRRGKRTLYMLWRDESTKLKSGLTDREWYEKRIDRLKTVPVLYIDDFFKARKTEGQTKVTDGDVNLAFEILNCRYNDKKLRTIISSELTLPEILDIDEATGGRIYERARGFVKKAPAENWRLK